MRFTVKATALVLICLLAGPAAAAELLKPYKERLFSYRQPIDNRDGGDFLRLPYDARKDINERDEYPVRKVKGYYVSSWPKRHQRDRAISANGRQIAHFAVGALDGGSAMTVIFVHGRDVTRDLGFDDDRFGGNFNRVKNLMFRNGGLYISTDFTDFANAGTRDVAALIEHYRPLTTGPMVIACGSMGAHLCWRLAGDGTMAAKIDGMIFLGGFTDPDFVATAASRGHDRAIPIYIAHGSLDSVYSWKDMFALYRDLRAAVPGYPVRYALFDAGKHGTPVRMIDWREALNWIAGR